MLHILYVSLALYGWVSEDVRMKAEKSQCLTYYCQLDRPAQRRTCLVLCQYARRHAFVTKLGQLIFCLWTRLWIALALGCYPWVQLSFTYFDCMYWLVPVATNSQFSIQRRSKMFGIDGKVMSISKNIRISCQNYVVCLLLNENAGCNACYVGETTRHFSTRVREHLAVDKASHIFKRL